MAVMKLGSKVEAFHLDGHAWVCNSELQRDIIIEIGEFSFHLHKFPLLSKSGLFKKLIGENQGGEEEVCILKFHDLPGGDKTFELVAKFCYDIKIELNSRNVAALRCAAEYLCMHEDLFGGNLISLTETFLNEIHGDWKESMNVLHTCENLLPLAEDLHIVNRCIDSLTTKACSDSNLLGWSLPDRSSSKISDGIILWNCLDTGENQKGIDPNCMYEDSSCLSLPLYKRLMLAMESKGVKPEIIAGSLTFYAMKHLRGLSRNSSLRINPVAQAPSLSETEQVALVEEIAGLLPSEKGVFSTTFLLRLLRTAMILHASSACRESLEKRIGAQLEDAFLDDLLIPNLDYSAETLYDIDCVQRMLGHFVSASPIPLVGAASPGTAGDGQSMDMVTSLAPMTLVAKLVDGYLSEVAPDTNLKFTRFLSFASLVPEYARPLDDGIYRAIDIYLKAHPWLTDSEREQLCRLLNFEKLSLEACTHAAQNERLPLRVVVQVLFFEQLRLRTSLAGWFFISDNPQNLHGAPSNFIVPPKSTDNEIVEEDMLESFPPAANEGMRKRVAELEKECAAMKQDIERLWRPRSSWSSACKRLLFRFGFGSRAY